MELLDPAQFYRSFLFDSPNKTLTILLEKTDEELFELWDRELSAIETVNVCLSGGLDSQFVLHLMSKLNKKINVYIFSWVWEDCIFNSPDVLHAIRYCNKFDYKYTNIEIDYKEFLHKNKHLQTCLKYKLDTPQIALQLAMLDLIDNNYPTILGGDPPIIQYDQRIAKSSVLGLHYQVTHTNAFLNYSLENNKVVIKDLFKINPKINFLCYQHFINITLKHKIVYPASNGLLVSHQPLRKLFYTELGAELLPPLLKNTGFETLKMHLAKKSGVYNQYDILYRYPLLATIDQQPWAINKLNIKFNNASLMKNFVDEHNKFCTTSDDYTVIEDYVFNL
jgi:hypothetical protein